ncbi:MAG: hypothetical protein RBU29_10320, partial [bacterium]|nr:hypothetical protein [bacterium]
MAHKSKTKNPSLPSKTISAPGWRESLSAHPWLTAVLVNGLLLLVVYYSALLAPRAIQQNEGVLQNPVLSHCKNIPLVFTQDFLLFTDGKYRPLSYALLTLPRMVFSADAILFWHGWLLCFHLINALLLFWLARQFTTRILPGLLVSVGFTVHPVSSVLVNNINQFYILFALSLVLLALNLYVRFSHTGQRWLYGGALVCSVLALFSAQMAFAIPLILLIYELGYCRTPLVKAGTRLLPFVVFPLLYIPLFYGLTPHPLHFKYVKTHEDSFWHGFYSITGATGLYAEALLLGRHLPLILHETIQQIFTWSNPQYLVWIWILLSSLTASFWFAWKKRWLGLGLATCILGMVPYCSVEINQVVNYIDWAYLYLPLAGFLLFLVGGLDWLQEWKKPALTWGGYVACGLLLLFWSGKTIQLNQYEKDAGTYWNHVFDLSGQKSPTALLAIGTNHLAQNQLSYAAHFFFTPMTKDIKAPCLAMAEYYSRRGEYLAAAIHLRYGSGLSSTGMVLEYECKAAANLLIAAQALDHAEENLGKILMVNPFSTWAMGRLAEVWIQKGFFQDARRMLEQMRVLAPSEPQVGRIEAVLQKAEAKLRAGENPAPIVPPSPDWLDYVLEQKFSSKLCRKIIELSQRADINDTVIQMEAMICHMLEGEYPQAAEKARVVYQCLSGYGYAASLVCEAVARSGDSRAAIPIGHRAVTLDTQSPMAWRALAIAYAGVSDLALDPAFEQTLERNPTMAAMFYSNLGEQKREQGRLAEAIASLQKALVA